MIAYIDRFPDEHGTRSIEVSPGSPFLFPGTFHFFEHYCNDPDCDCRTVLIVVCEATDTSKPLAAIVWGFDWADYYQKWMADEESAHWMVAAHFAPEWPQSDWAQDCLDMVRAMVTHDGDDWDAQIAERYRKYKATLGPPSQGGHAATPLCLKDVYIRGESTPED